MGSVIENMEVEVPKPLCKQIEFPKEASQERELIAKEHTVMKLVSFARAYQSEEQSSISDLFIYMVEGTMDVYVEGRKHIVTAGETIIVPVSVVYYFVALEACKFLVLETK